MADPQSQFTVGNPSQIPGMVQPGNIDLSNRPVIQNDDGSHSSEFSTSFGDENGHEVLVPTIANGKFLTSSGKKPKPGSQEEKELLGYRDKSGNFHKGAAQKYYEKTHQHLGIFDSPEHADAYAEIVHNRNQMADPTIEQPLSSGATDHPTGPNQLPVGLSNAPPAKNPLPAGLSDTPPATSGNESNANSGDSDELSLSPTKAVNQLFPSDTVGKDISGAIGSMTKLPGQMVDYLADKVMHPKADEIIRQNQEAHKVQVYQDVKNDMKAGNYAKAFSRLGDLFDPSYDDPKDPIGQLVQQQWDSSKLAKQRMLDAAKKKDYAAVVQHAAGILPIASQVDSAMENYRKDPSRENLGHIISAAIPAFVPTLVKGAKYVYEGADSTLDALAKADAPDAVETAVKTPTPTLTPKEVTVQKSVQKAGLPEGTDVIPATPATKTETPSETTETQPPQGTMHEPVLQNSFRQRLNDFGKSEGLEPVSDTVDLRDVAHNISDQLFNRSKAGFKAIKDATGVDLNVLRDQINDAKMKQSETFGDPDKEGKIIERINTLEGEATQAITDAEKAGVNTNQPLHDWKLSSAARDLGEQVRASVDPTAKSGTFDPTKLAPRVEKLYRSNYANQPGRLEQLLGKEGAEGLRDDTYAAVETQKALKDFKPQKTTTPGQTIETPATPEIPATDSKALYDLVRKNTSRDVKIGNRTIWKLGNERTNWVKVYDDFDKMTPEAQKASYTNPVEVEQILRQQAKNQRYRAIAMGVGAAALAHEFGVDNYILHKIVEFAK